MIWSPRSILLILTALTGVPHHAGKVVIVKMIQNAQGPRFDPSDVSISQDDAIQFVNVSGGPHNVAFDEATIPAAAKDPLSAGMPDHLSPLMGPMIAAPNGAYTMRFAHVPAGKYSYSCTPHRMLGMVGVVTVK